MNLAKFKDFDTFFESLLPHEQAICFRMRELILGNFPELKEKFAYGAPFYHLNTRICFLYPASLPYSGIKTGVSFGLNRGYLISNQYGLLDMGNRKEMAYIHLNSESDIREEAFLEILQEAVLLDIELAKVKKR